MRDKVGRLLQPNGDARGLEGVDDEPDDVMVAGGKRLVEDRPPRAAPGRGVRPRSKEGNNARGVALVGGVMRWMDDGEQAKRILSGVEGCLACHSGLGINRSVRAFEYRSSETSAVLSKDRGVSCRMRLGAKSTRVCAGMQRAQR